MLLIRASNLGEVVSRFSNICFLLKEGLSNLKKFLGSLILITFLIQSAVLFITITYKKD